MFSRAAFIKENRMKGANAARLDENPGQRPSY
jgi:hypothetical protein